MGSSVSIVLAEAAMQKIERDNITNAPFDIKLWIRYVDDVLAIIPKYNSHNILNYINSINP